MTEITFDGLRMRAKGHAGFAKYGEDVVCAGLSTLFVTVEEIIIEMRDEGLLAEEPEVQLCSGDVVLAMEPREKGRYKAETLWEFLRTGVKLLAERYPQYVVITSADADE